MDSVGDEFCDAHARLPGTQEHETVVFDRDARDACGAQYPGQDDRGCALDVVIETAHLFCWKKRGQRQQQQQQRNDGEFFSLC